jgi:tripeptidyl-peptidase-1
MYVTLVMPLSGHLANVDQTEYGVTLARGTPVVYYSVGGRGPLDPDLDQPDASAGTNEPYLELLQYLLGLKDADLPDVLSTSYGEDEQSVPCESPSPDKKHR